VEVLIGDSRDDAIRRIVDLDIMSRSSP